MTVNERNGPLVASFPIEEGGQIMLVTDAGKLIRVPVEHISIIGRSTQGVTIFNTAEGERVMYVEGIPEEEGDEGEQGDDGDDAVTAHAGNCRSPRCGPGGAVEHRNSWRWWNVDRAARKRCHQ